MLEIVYRNRMQFFALALLIMLSVILTTIPSVSAEDHDISITDAMKFNPEDLTINVGDTVTWTNNDGMAHTATSTDGPVSFDSGNIASGATWSFTFTEAGTYDYKCAYHSSMTATITVVESDSGGDNDEEEDPVPRSDSDWFNWTMSGPHNSILAITNESLNWTHLIVSIYNETGAYTTPSWYNAVEYESDLAMNHTWLDNGTYNANITLYNLDTILAYHNWTFLIEEATENEGNITEPVEGCMDINAINYNSEATKDDSSCEYPEPEPVEGCTNETATNYNSTVDIDDGSCEYTDEKLNYCPDEITDENKDLVEESCLAVFDEPEESKAEESRGFLPSLSFLVSICVIAIIAFRRR